jgi:homoserine/homoserine lactone efflux protein
MHGGAHAPPRPGYALAIALDLYLAYVLACAVITLVPGPTVTVIIANSLAHGARAGLLNVAGTQLGLALMMAILVVGLSSVIAAMGWLFDWLRFIGAAYLVWLGWKLLRAPDAIAEAGSAPTPTGGFFLQGFLVLMANPKALLWFGAFIPQFVDPKGDYIAQTVLLGVTAMAVALVSDGAYAVLTGRAGALLTRKRVRLVSRLSGACLVGGGVWLALTRAR